MWGGGDPSVPGLPGQRAQRLGTVAGAQEDLSCSVPRKSLSKKRDVPNPRPSSSEEQPPLHNASQQRLCW